MATVGPNDVVTAPGGWVHEGSIDDLSGRIRADTAESVEDRLGDLRLQRHRGRIDVGCLRELVHRQV